MQIITSGNLTCLFAVVEYAHGAWTDQRKFACLVSENTPLAQASHIYIGIENDIFGNTLLACLSGMSFGVGIQLVWVDLEGD